MLRNDHRIMIHQTVDGADHWTTLRLFDQSEHLTDGNRYVSGTWRHTNASYNDQTILFTSDHPQYLTFIYVGNASGGILNIESTMGRASHRADEKTIVTNYLHLYYVQRTSNGEFKVGSVLGNGVGDLRSNYAKPHFKAGDIGWTVSRY